jgi:hypothetical protein
LIKEIAGSEGGRAIQFRHKLDSSGAVEHRLGLARVEWWARNSHHGAGSNFRRRYALSLRPVLKTNVALGSWTVKLGMSICRLFDIRQQTFAADSRRILAELNTGGLIPHEKVMRSMQLLCEKVQPRLH